MAVVPRPLVTRPSTPSWVPLSSALFLVCTAGVTYFWVGDLSEAVEPRYADYLWRPWPFLDGHQTLIGVVSVVGLVVAGSALATARRAGRMRAPLLAQVVVLTLFAAWLGSATG